MRLGARLVAVAGMVFALAASTASAVDPLSPTATPVPPSVAAVIARVEAKARYAALHVGPTRGRREDRAGAGLAECRAAVHAGLDAQALQRGGGPARLRSGLSLPDACLSHRERSSWRADAATSCSSHRATSASACAIDRTGRRRTTARRSSITATPNGDARPDAGAAFQSAGRRRATRAPGARGWDPQGQRQRRHRRPPVQHVFRLARRCHVAGWDQRELPRHHRHADPPRTGGPHLLPAADRCVACALHRQDGRPRFGAFVAGHANGPERGHRERHGARRRGPTAPGVLHPEPGCLRPHSVHRGAAPRRRERRREVHRTEPAESAAA